MVSGVLLSAALLGGVLCSEARGLIDRPGGRREILAIAQVAMNRARRDRRPLDVELRRPGQWAAPACPAGEARRFERLAGRFLAGKVKAPRWSRRAVAFAAPAASRRVAGAWRRLGYRPINGTGTVHVFWRATR